MGDVKSRRDNTENDLQHRLDRSLPAMVGMDGGETVPLNAIAEVGRIIHLTDGRTD